MKWPNRYFWMGVAYTGIPALGAFAMGYLLGRLHG